MNKNFNTFSELLTNKNINKFVEKYCFYFKQKFNFIQKIIVNRHILKGQSELKKKGEKCMSNFINIQY